MALFQFSAESLAVKAPHTRTANTLSSGGNARFSPALAGTRGIFNRITIMSPISGARVLDLLPIVSYRCSVGLSVNIALYADTFAVSL